MTKRYYRLLKLVDHYPADDPMVEVGTPIFFTLAIAAMENNTDYIGAIICEDVTDNMVHIQYLELLKKRYTIFSREDIIKR